MSLSTIMIVKLSNIIKWPHKFTFQVRVNITFKWMNEDHKSYSSSKADHYISPA